MLIIDKLDILRQISEDVSSDEYLEIRDKLLEEIKGHDQAIGLSAIQIGIPKRIFITRYDVSSDLYENYQLLETKGIHWNIWVNPKIEEVLPETMTCEEGCLSFPGRTVLTKRHKQITVTTQTLDEWSQRETHVLYGLDSIVFQHELDHLDGKLMFERGEELYLPRTVPLKIGRNDLCNCGSGKKFKKCCGKNSH